MAAEADAHSLRVVSWGTGSRSATDLIASASEMARHNRQPGDVVSYDSAKGAQSTVFSIDKLLEGSDLMGTVDRALANVIGERYFAITSTLP